MQKDAKRVYKPTVCTCDLCVHKVNRMKKKKKKATRALSELTIDDVILT